MLNFVRKVHHFLRCYILVWQCISAFHYSAKDFGRPIGNNNCYSTTMGNNCPTSSA